MLFEHQQACPDGHILRPEGQEIAFSNLCPKRASPSFGPKYPKFSPILIKAEKQIIY
jgi:hypothetical protein